MKKTSLPHKDGTWYNELTLRLFRWKTLCKDSFPCFPVFCRIKKKKKKKSQRKTIFRQHKKYDLFLKIVFH